MGGLHLLAMLGPCATSAALGLAVGMRVQAMRARGPKPISLEACLPDPEDTRWRLVPGVICQHDDGAMRHSAYELGGVVAMVDCCTRIDGVRAMDHGPSARYSARVVEAQQRRRALGSWEP